MAIKYVMEVLYIQILVLKDTEILLKVKDLIFLLFAFSKYVKYF